MYYNGEWNIPHQGGFLGYSFTGTNPIRFGITSRCSMEKLKDLIKQVAPIGVLPYEIHKKPGHAKYFENLIEYEITELKNNKDMLKVLAQSNYWKRFCPIEILAIFNKPTTEIEKRQVSYAAYLRLSLILSYLHCN